MITIIIREKHIELSNRSGRAGDHPIALAINERLRPEYRATVTNSNIMIWDHAFQDHSLFDIPLPPKCWDVQFAPGPAMELDLNIPARFLRSDTEAEYFTLPGCMETDQEPEEIRFFDNLDCDGMERQAFYRLVFALRRNGIAADEMIEIGRAFYALAQRRPIFASHIFPPGFIGCESNLEEMQKQLESGFEFIRRHGE